MTTIAAGGNVTGADTMEITMGLSQKNKNRITI